jgi:hypothetical protein
LPAAGLYIGGGRLFWLLFGRAKSNKEKAAIREKDESSRFWGVFLNRLILNTIGK